MLMRMIVTAAGASRRMGGLNKLLLQLDGVPILVRTLQVFQEYEKIDTVLVSAPPGQEEEYRRLCREHHLTKVSQVVTGGRERQDSIRNALEALESGPDDALGIHDGARPLVKGTLLNRLLGALVHCDGALPMVAVKDTIKRVGPRGEVLETLDRSELFAAQTPQVFRYRTILAAHRRACQEGHIGTDDASLVERYGGRVSIVEGDYANLKITTPEDLRWAQLLLEQPAGTGGGKLG